MPIPLLTATFYQQICKSSLLARLSASQLLEAVVQDVEKGKLLISLPKSRQLAAESSDVTLQSLIDKVPPDLWAAKLALPVRAGQLPTHS